MVRHRGGKVGQAGKTLAKKTSGKSAKTKAAKILKSHQSKKH